MKKKVRILGVILLLLIIPATLSFVPIGNNIILQKYNRELKKIKLNADYEILASDSRCGKLIGNGNGMQFFSILLIHANETLKWKNNDWEGVFLIDIDDDSYRDFMNKYRGEFSPNFMKKLKEITNTDDYYVLYSFYNADIDSIWNSDLRAR